MKKNLIAVAVAAMFVGTVGVANAAGGIPGLGDSNINNNANTNTNVNTATSGAAANAAAGAVGFGGAGGAGGQGGAADVDLRNTNTNSAFGGAGGSVLGSGNAAQHQGQHQGQEQGQDQGQSQSANNNGNAQNTTINQNYNAPKQHRNNPNVYAPSVFPTAPCRTGTSLGFSGLGFGVSGATYTTDNECEIRQTSQALANLGEDEAAREVICQSDYARKTSLCEKVRKENVVKTSSNSSNKNVVSSEERGSNLVINNNVVSDAATGTVYGFITSNGTYRAHNTMPEKFRNELAVLMSEQ